MTIAYDDQNIFAKILRGEIPSEKIAETEHSVAFRDIRPQAPVHVLVIPKGAYVTYADFARDASEAEIVDFTRLLGKLAVDLDLTPTASDGGHRMISNAGADANQEVPHMHMHLVGGRTLGGLLPGA
ncbi:MAG: HIT domain-containing protein [Pseudomonadota bacterium]